MKKQLLTIMSESGHFLTDFKFNHEKLLAYSVTYTDSWEHAIKGDYESINEDEENMNQIKAFAEAVQGNLVIIDIDYELKDLETGEPVKEVDVTEQKKQKEEDFNDFKESLGKLLGL